MDCRTVALIALYIFVGFVIYVLLAIPPGDRWDGNVDWGDVATWAGAVASTGAVVVALALSTRESRARQKEAADAERIFAPGIAEELIQLRWVCGQILAIHADSAGEENRPAYRTMLAHLESCRAPTLDLVAARDVYRGDRGRLLMTLYAAILRLQADIHKFPRIDMLEVVHFAQGQVANAARDISAKADAALDSIWAIAAAKGTPIPDRHIPPNGRPPLIVN
ncbi:hypothetical protein [Luteibacter sp. UNC138MFCol5.1]|uniref:hypothetical protein n=1 Tax=Luteibacter sp. UNC138MFCol5.1 TaxID=1502774 RepID=UPI0011602401|nr:hypothetical protein [Luteibacter sp. UNC138MFCol5.1]